VVTSSRYEGSILLSYVVHRRRENRIAAEASEREVTA
jgi:hypothetical protein